MGVRHLNAFDELGPRARFSIVLHLTQSSSFVQNAIRLHNCGRGLKVALHPGIVTCINAKSHLLRLAAFHTHFVLE